MRGPGTTSQRFSAPDQDTDWRQRAACRPGQGFETEMFFPVGTKGPAAKQIAKAKTVCAGCVARAECLEWALNTGQDCGIWGGMSEDERRRLKRRNERWRARTA